MHPSSNLPTGRRSRFDYHYSYSISPSTEMFENHAGSLFGEPVHPLGYDSSSSGTPNGSAGIKSSSEWEVKMTDWTNLPRPQLSSNNNSLKRAHNNNITNVNSYSNNNSGFNEFEEPVIVVNSASSGRSSNSNFKSQNAFTVLPIVDGEDTSAVKSKNVRKHGHMKAQAPLPPVPNNFRVTPTKRPHKKSSFAIIAELTPNQSRATSPDGAGAGAGRISPFRGRGFKSRSNSPHPEGVGSAPDSLNQKSALRSRSGSPQKVNNYHPTFAKTTSNPINDIGRVRSFSNLESDYSNNYIETDNSYKTLIRIQQRSRSGSPQKPTKMERHYENLQKIQNNIRAIESVNNALSKKPPIPKPRNRSPDFKRSVPKQSRIPRRKSISVSSSPVHKPRPSPRHNSSSPPRRRTDSVSPNRNTVNQLPSRSLAPRNSQRGKRSESLSPCRDTVSSTNKAVKSPRTLRRNVNQNKSNSSPASRSSSSTRKPDYLTPRAAQKSDHLSPTRSTISSQNKIVPKSPKAPRRLTHSSLKIPNLSPIQGTPTKVESNSKFNSNQSRIPKRPPNSKTPMTSKNPSRNTSRDPSPQVKGPTTPTKIPQKITPGVKRTSSVNKITKPVMSKGNSKKNLLKDSKRNSTSSLMKNEKQNGKNQAHKAPIQEMSIDDDGNESNDDEDGEGSKDEDGEYSKYKENDSEDDIQHVSSEAVKEVKGKSVETVVSSSEKLIPLTKSNVVSMTTAAITAQPVQIATNVTNQLPNMVTKPAHDLDKNENSEASTNKPVPPLEHRRSEKHIDVNKIAEKAAETVSGVKTDAKYIAEKLNTASIQELKSMEKIESTIDNAASAVNTAVSKGATEIVSKVEKKVEAANDNLQKMSKEAKTVASDVKKDVKEFENSINNNLNKTVLNMNENLNHSVSKMENKVTNQVDQINKAGHKAMDNMKMTVENEKQKLKPIASRAISTEKTSIKEPPEVDVQSANEANSNHIQIDEHGEEKKPGCCSRICCLPCSKCCKKKTKFETIHEKESCWKKLSCRKKKKPVQTSTSSIETITAENLNNLNATPPIAEQGNKSCGKLCLNRFLCCKSVNKVESSENDEKQGCCSCRKKQKKKTDAWVDNRRESILSQPQRRCCKNSCLCLPLFCCSAPCCLKKPEEDPSSRRTSMMSKKQSLAPTLPPEDKRPKLDVSLVEHTSIMKGAIPVLPIPLAWFCLICNVICPGLGTLFSGMFCLCFGIPRFGIHDSARGRVCSFLINIVIAAGQLFTVLFCLVGWGWSIWWGYIMLKISRKHKKIKQDLKDQEEEDNTPIAVNQNHNDIEQAR